MEKKIFSIVYEGEEKPKLPRGSGIVYSGFEGDNLYELLAATVVHSVICEEGFSFSQFKKDTFIKILADYFECTLVEYFAKLGKEEAVELPNSFFNNESDNFDDFFHRFLLKKFKGKEFCVHYSPETLLPEFVTVKGGKATKRYLFDDLAYLATKSGEDGDE